METAQIVNISIGLFLLLFAGFCWVKQGSLVKGKGWLSRAEAPKMFWVNMVVLVVIAAYMLVFGIR
ncbi:MAG: hypothetical protein VXY11_02465 [Candidatus Thermoplasmatota archaeon]|nr:hypothetical protein [Candidatus Thermoplasmatota archaeon]